MACIEKDLDPDNKEISISARDITEPMPAEESLRCREEYYRALIENITDLITVVAADGTILYESTSLERIMGYSPDEVIGKNNFDFLHPDDVPSLLARFTKGIGNPSAVEPFKARIRHKNGSWRIVEGVGKNLLDDPAVGGIVFTSRDITERKRLEEQFLQSQKMETIGRLAGGVAHDLNNILTVILSYAGFVRDALPADSPIKEDIAEVLTASKRATSLIRQILAFSRRQVIRPQVINLNVLILEMDKMLRRLIGEDVRFVTIPGPDLGCVRVDPGQMEQVIANLAVNARDAMPSGGKLLIETANVTIGQEIMDRHMDALPGNHVMLAVSDTGIGMTEEVKSHLFEPFFTTKGPGKGSGLGLATVYGIVRQHKGAIWAYSEPGRGTTFKIYLPRCEDLPGALPLELSAQPSLGGTETVLVVEDEVSVRKATERTLKRLGYTILQAQCGEDALLAAEGHTGEIHLLLTDIVMPGMNGRELARRISARRPGIKVIFMSGYTDTVIKNNGTLPNGMEFLQKPFSADTLAAKVRKTLDNSRPPSRAG